MGQRRGAGPPLRCSGAPGAGWDPGDGAAARRGPAAGAPRRCSCATRARPGGAGAGCWGRRHRSGGLRRNRHCAVARAGERVTEGWVNSGQCGPAVATRTREQQRAAPFVGRTIGEPIVRGPDKLKPLGAHLISFFRPRPSILIQTLGRATRASCLAKLMVMCLIIRRS